MFESTLTIADDGMEEEAKGRLIKESIRNVLFLGELMKQSLLPAKVLLSCVEDLLQHMRNALLKHNPEHASAEMSAIKISRVLLLAGEALEAKPASKEQLKRVLGDIAALIKLPSITRRARYALLDVLDAAGEGWQLRRVVEGPQTIEALHAKAFSLPERERAIISYAIPTVLTFAEEEKVEQSPTTTTFLPGRRTVVRRVVYEHNEATGESNEGQ